jgi:Ca-activated chloride channel family protein
MLPSLCRQLFLQEEFMKATTAIFIFKLTFVSILNAQDAGHFLRKGDALYRDSAFAEAEECYRKAGEWKPGFKTHYNTGNSLYLQGRAGEAAEHYRRSLNSAVDPEQQSKAYFNLGNANFRSGDYAQSAEAFRDALVRNPDDEDARANYAMARRKLMQQPSQEPRSAPPPAKANESSENETPPSGSKENRESKTRPTPAPENASPEPKLGDDQMDQLFRLVERQDQMTRQKLQKAQAPGTHTGKPW